ncbi:sulfotransferase domain-containing protein [Fulvivirga sediminis]|uniref:Sulfotransferase n=1 Tax=Fulvivirga sediminis TaxID=2803949 RepID=A0A937FB87_9BACT|nr:sulfotransferase domain-containing protein [Fulvivirga sediminis]MBL3659045.1 sulfotransferase [Fulvivirga sediminis]
MNKFILLAHPRSGSTLLISYLKSHGQILAHGEVFNENECDLSPLVRPNITGEELMKRRDKDPIAFLENYVFINTLPWKKITGFKIHYQQANEGKKEVWNYLANDRSLKIIHLTRENSLEAYTSLMLAIKTNKWTQTTDSPSPKLTIALDQLECRYFFKRIERNREYYNNLFKNHQILHLTYDELYKNKKNTLTHVQEFLNVNIEDLDADLRKQNKTPLPEVIENYNALKQAFSKTQWERFFTS